MAGTLAVYSPVASSTFPVFVNHHCYQVPKHCHQPRKYPLPLGSHPPSPLAARTLLSAPVDLLVLDISHRRNQTTRALSCLAFFPLVQPAQGSSSLYQELPFSWLNNIPPYGKITCCLPARH